MLTQEQKQTRRTGIGGSDAAAVCGVDPYRTPTEVFLSKVDEDYDVDLSGNEPVEHGNAFEGAIADIFTKRLGVKVFKPEMILRHPEHVWMIASPDRLVVGQDKGVEIKNRSFFMRSNYGREGSSDVFPSDMLQCQHYMAVTGFPEWDLWVCFGGQKSVRFHIKRNNNYIKNIIKIESAFWHNSVLTQTPPTPQTLGDVELLFKADEAVKLVANEEMAEKINHMRRLKENERSSKANFEHLKSELCLLMKEAASIVDEEGKTLLTWREAKEREAFDAPRFKKDRADLYSSYLTQKKGARRFILKGDENEQ